MFELRRNSEHTHEPHWWKSLKKGEGRGQVFLIQNLFNRFAWFEHSKTNVISRIIYVSVDESSKPHRMKHVPIFLFQSFFLTDDCLMIFYLTSRVCFIDNLWLHFYVRYHLPIYLLLKYNFYKKYFRYYVEIRIFSDKSEFI